jgi:acetyl-CoA acetyltransferase
MRTFVVGVGMTRFEAPGRREWDYPYLGWEAGEKALFDGGVHYDDVEAAFVGFCYGDSGSGQRALYEMGMTGVPIVNVNNNCATGSTALFLARRFVEGGLANCVLALGFEKMERESLSLKVSHRTAPIDRHLEVMHRQRGVCDAPMAAQMFGNVGREYMERYGVTARTIAMVAEKNHRHSVHNPNSQLREQYTLNEILASPMVYEPLTRLQCCPTSDGGAAAVVVSEDFVRTRCLWDRAIEVVGQAMATDCPDTFDGSDMSLVGVHVSKQAARAAYDESGLGPEDVQVIELHDCFTPNELVAYEALGLCDPGKAGDLVLDGATTYGGRWVVNPSGGLISKGHPLGATGLAQCAELVWQLRGEAGGRQVPGATAALQHNIGIGGAAVVTIYRRPFPPQTANDPRE